MTTATAPEPVGVTPADIRDATGAERRLLSAVLGAGGGPDVIDTVAAIVTVSDFAHDAHAAVYGAALDLHNAGEPPTLDGVFLHLRRAGRAADLGHNPALWLADLFADRGPIGTYAEVWAKKVRDLAVRRRAKRLAVALHREADAPGPAADVLARCEQLLFEAADPAGSSGGPKSARELVAAALARVDDRAERGGALNGLSTGLAGLDDLLGGLKPGQLIVVGARPGVGKTALALRVALANSAAGVPTLVVSAEMPESEIIDRALTQRSGVPMRAITSGRVGSDDAGRLTDAGRQLAAEPFYVDDSSGLTASRVASELRRAVRRRAVRRRRVGLCVVDYLQLLTPDNARDNRTTQVGAMARTLKLAARQCGVPLVLLCQLNREVEGRNGGRPRLSDLRDSGEIEQHADDAILLHVQPDQPTDADVWKVDAIVAKNRNGPPGETTLDYVRPTLRFDQSAK